MSTRHARRIQAAYLGWCYIHGLKAASVKNLYWYAAQQSPEAQRALLGSSPTGLVDPKKMWNNFNELNVHGQGGVGHAPHKQQQQQPQTQTSGGVRPGESLDEYFARTGVRRWAEQMTGPFAGYEDFEDCESQNSDKGDSGAYCGEIHHKVQQGRERKGEPLHDHQDKQSRRKQAVTDPELLRLMRQRHKFAPDHPEYQRITDEINQRFPSKSMDETIGDMRNKVSSRKQAWSGWGPAVFPKTRQVTGWKWDPYLDGYTSNSPQKFACECGDSFPTPSGFQRCACGKQWNSYVIGTGGTNREAAAEKFLVREIPVRPEGNVIVAARDEDFRDEKFDEPEEAQYKQHIIDQYNPKENRRTACWPGCHENEAHAKKYHKKKDAGRHDDPFAPDNYDEFTHVHDPAELNTVGGRPGMSRDLGPGTAHHPRHQATVRLVDPRTGKVHSLVDPGEIDDKDGDEAHHNKTKVKKPPSDWAHRGDGAKWRKRTFGEG